MSMDIVFCLNLLFGFCLLFSSGFNHILKVLLSLELIVVSVLMLIIMMTSLESFVYLSLYFLIFSVCESILGLSLVVLMVRYYGNDYVKSVNLLI